MGYVDVSPSKDDSSTFTILYRWETRPWYAPERLIFQTKEIGSADDLERAIAGGDKFAEKKCGRDVVLQ